MQIFTMLRSSGLLVQSAALVMVLAYASNVHGQRFRTTAQMEITIKRLETKHPSIRATLKGVVDTKADKE